MTRLLNWLKPTRRLKSASVETRSRRSRPSVEALEDRLTPTASPNLLLTDTPGASTYHVGDTVTFTVSVTVDPTAGPVAAGNPVYFAEDMDSGLSNINVSGTNWSISPTDSDYAEGTYTGAYPIAPGTTLPPITITGTATTSTIGTFYQYAEAYVEGIGGDGYQEPYVTILGLPTATDGSATTAENIASPITVTASDPSTPPLPLTYAITTPPTNGTLTGIGPNYTYTPNAGYFGPDNFQFQVTNSINLTSNIATESILVAAPPTASDGSATTAENTAQSLTVTASDPNSPAAPPLTYTITTPPTNGVLTGTGPDYTYTPNTGYFGPDSFQFTANNGVSDSNAATESINVVAPPTATGGIATVAENTAQTITLTGSDSNSPPLELTYTITTPPTNGVLTGTGPNLTYTPNTGYVGPDSFQFSVNNGTSDSNVATESINIAVLPTATGGSVTTVGNTALPITVTASDSNSPALPLTYAITTPPAHGTLTGTGPDYTYTPTAGYAGPDSFQFQVTNTASLSSNIATESITVTPPPFTADERFVRELYAD